MLISKNSKQIKMANPIFSMAHCDSSVAPIMQNDGFLQDDLSSLCRGLNDESFSNSGLADFEDFIDTDLSAFGSLLDPDTSINMEPLIDDPYFNTNYEQNQHERSIDQTHSVSNDPQIAADESEDEIRIPWVAEECTIDSNVDEVSETPLSKVEKRNLSSRHRSPLSERKLRKKYQNKTAAEKYRLKKRLERQNLLEKEANLKSDNKKLKNELDSLNFRIEHLKELMFNVFPISQHSKQ